VQHVDDQPGRIAQGGDRERQFPGHPGGPDQVGLGATGPDHLGDHRAARHVT
jgi:hypothetical protein